MGAFVLPAQELFFEHYNEVNGLSHNSVRSIVQDDKGFLWLGTFGGVNRFDGYDFKVFHSDINKTDYLHSDDILEIVLDKRDNLWIATDYGLTKYNIPTSSFKTYHANSKGTFALVGNNIRSVFADVSDRIWVGTKDNGLCYYSFKNDRFYKINIGNTDNIRSIYQTQDGRIWFTTFNHGVYSFFIDEEGNVSQIKNYDLLPADTFQNDSDAYFILEDKLQNIYVGTRDGLYKFDKTESAFQLLRKDDSINDYFRCYTVSPDGTYWFGTSNGLIECNDLDDIETGRFKRHIPDLKSINSLANNYVISLCFDDSGVLWIGTENGLDKLDPFENQFKTIKTNFTSDGKIPIISSFAKTYNDKLLLGTHSSGLFLKEGNSFTQVLNKYRTISSIYTVDDTVFYIGLWNGNVVEFDIKNNTEKLLDVGFKSSPVLSFYKASNSSLFIGSGGEGLIQYNLKTASHEVVKGNLNTFKDINKIVSSHNNIIWLATEEGVFKYNTISKEIRHYATQANKSSLSNNKVKDLIIDKKGKVWVGTRKGLNYYDPLSDNFVLQEQPIELKNSWVTDIAIDSLGVMWLNMNYNKIAKYDVKTNEYRSFHINNGVRSNLINKRGFLYYDNSRIYIGGDKEIIYFSPTGIKENTKSPEPIITEFKIQNKEVIPGGEIEKQTILTEDLNYSKAVELNYNNRNFSVQFSLPSFANERLNEFQYKLEGFDEDWNTTSSSSRVIQYTNLYPDDYVLKVKGANNNGYWSKESSYNITVLPPFWLTYQFFIIVLIIISALIYLIRKQIKYRISLKQELLLEKVRRERDEKLNNEKLRFFTNISHELRTPLTLILGPVKQLLGNENISTYDKGRANLIHQNANRLLRLVNQILDFRRAESGELKLRVAKTEVLQHTKSIFNSFIELAQSKRISMNLNVEHTTLECWIDLDKYNKILYNLLSNAVKFTNDYGNVDLFIGVEEGEQRKLVVEVSDDGIGIPERSIDKIFNRFYQAKNSKENTTGTGIGLSLVKALIEIHKGDIKVESEPDFGSIFTVTFPIYKEAYKEDEIFEFTQNKVDTSEFEIVKAKKARNNTEIKHRVLVIDDNRELRKFLVEYLSDFYKVYEADNGEKGLEVCKKVKPVLCVVDAMMPVKDGFEFVEALKNDPNISHTAVIMLTALAENENRIKGYKIGVDGYLVKPFDPTLLRTRIDNVIKIHFDLKQKFLGDVESDVITLANSQIDIDLISKVTRLIEENIGNPELSTSFLCNELAMSSSKLYRKIKHLTDLSPNEFIRTIRLKKSATMLKTKNYNVSEVSTIMGFNDPLYFSRVFKKQFGYSPSKLIK